MMNTRHGSSSFTTSQWQELENQVLIFKYMVSGVPIPPDLISPIKRSLDSTLSSILFPRQPIGWDCFQVGFGRKADPEPGRCRRTDGKKWRCSKETYPDSKYCERHMHRGRNRSRKPVEAIPSKPFTPISSIATNQSTITTTPYSLSSSVVAAETHHHHDHPYYNASHYPFLYPQSEVSATVTSVPDSHFDNPWPLRPLRMMSSSSLTQAKGKSCSALQLQLQLQSFTDISKQKQEKQNQEQHLFILGADLKSERPMKVEREEEGTQQQQPLLHFFDEWTPKNRDYSTTQLSISIPMSSPDLPMSNFRTQNDG